MSSGSRKILVTNDDGIQSAGIAALVEVAKQYGEVVVVAPEFPQSGMGHAITIHEPLRLKKMDLFDGVEAYQCTGTPVDCVKLAVHWVYKDQNPDLCFSGINHGSNCAVNVIYSGTMSAAMEASFHGIPSIGFSFLDFNPNANLLMCKEYAKKVIDLALEKGMPQGNLLNVNFPMLESKEIKGIRVCRQADARWIESFEEREDPFNGQYFWLTGEFVNNDKGEDCDVYALNQGFVSVVPVQHDLTAYSDIELLNKKWNL